eukprot:RCo004264
MEMKGHILHNVSVPLEQPAGRVRRLRPDVPHCHRVPRGSATAGEQPLTSRSPRQGVARVRHSFIPTLEVYLGIRDLRDVPEVLRQHEDQHSGAGLGLHCDDVGVLRADSRPADILPLHQPNLGHVCDRLAIRCGRCLDVDLRVSLRVPTNLLQDCVIQLHVQLSRRGRQKDLSHHQGAFLLAAGLAPEQQLVHVVWAPVFGEGLRGAGKPVHGEGGPHQIPSHDQVVLVRGVLAPDLPLQGFGFLLPLTLQLLMGVLVDIHLPRGTRRPTGAEREGGPIVPTVVGQKFGFRVSPFAIKTRKSRKEANDHSEKMIT